MDWKEVGGVAVVECHLEGVILCRFCGYVRASSSFGFPEKFDCRDITNTCS